MKRRTISIYFVLSLLLIVLLSVILLPRAVSAQTSTPIPQADLVITQIITSPYNWTGGCTTTLDIGIRVTVRNAGAAPAPVFYVSVYQGGEAAQNVPNGLQPGESITLWFSNNGAMTVTADSFNMVEESNETNNTVSYTSITATAPVLCTRTITPTITPTPLLSPTRTLTHTPTHRTITPWATRTITKTPTNGTSMPTRTLTRTLTNTLTPTATPTCPCLITPTRTPTPTPTISPTIPAGGTCSPVNATITAPFMYDGPGAFCWQSSNLGSYINSWNTTSVIVNGGNYTNLYVPVSALPAKINGYWYIRFNSAVAWGHFEAK